MKFFLPLIAFVAAAAALVAQTNAPVAKPERAPTRIFSDSLEADLKTHTAVYRGNVRVEDPQMKLTCDVLTASMPEGGKRIESIIAETNVVVDALDEKGRNSHATAGKLVYTYKVVGVVTNENIELSGNPRVTNAIYGLLEGELITWDKTADKVFVKAFAGAFRPGGSNSIPSALKLPATPKN